MNEKRGRVAFSQAIAEIQGQPAPERGGAAGLLAELGRANGAKQAAAVEKPSPESGGASKDTIEYY